MRWYLVPFLLLFSIPAYCQYPNNYETLCQQGSTPVSGPSGTTFDSATGKYRAVTCVDPFGNVTIAGVGGVGLSIIDPTNFGVPTGVGQGVKFCLVQYTSGSSLVTTGANDAVFTPSMVGGIFYGTNTPCAGNIGILASVTEMSVANCKVLTVNGPHSANMTCNSAGNAGSASCCYGAYVPADYTANFQSAFNALLAKCGQMMELPAGNFLFSAPITHANPQLCGTTASFGINQQGFTVKGKGMNSTTFFIADTLSCAGMPTDSNGTVGIMFGAANATQGIQYSDFGLDGIGNFNGNANCSGVPFFRGENAGIIRDILELEYSGSGGLANKQLNAFAAEVSGVNNFNFGPICGDFTSVGMISIFNVTCFGQFGMTFRPATGFSVTSTASTWGTANSGSAAVTVLSTGVWNSKGDTCSVNSPSGTTCVKVGSSAATANIDGMTFQGLTPSTTFVLSSGGFGILHLRNTALVGTTCISGGVAGSQFFDDGGNTYTGCGGFNFTNIQVIGEANSANSIAVTAAKLVLSAGWGSTAANTALTGGNAPIQFTITNNGIGQAASPTITYTFPTPWLVVPFSCTATQTGGTNAIGTFTSSALTTTGVTFTFSLTPTASSTEIVQVTCVTP